MKVFALTPSNDILQKRHLEDSYARVDIEQSIILNNKIKELINVEHIDYSSLSIKEIAELIVKH